MDIKSAESAPRRPSTHPKQRFLLLICRFVLANNHKDRRTTGSSEICQAVKYAQAMLGKTFKISPTSLLGKKQTPQYKQLFFNQTIQKIT
jgi:hypothetical protein